MKWRSLGRALAFAAIGSLPGFVIGAVARPGIGIAVGILGAIIGALRSIKGVSLTRAGLYALGAVARDVPGAGSALEEIAEEEGALILNPDPVITAIVEAIKKGEAPETISARFHNSLARGILQMALQMKENTGISEIILSGGVFQNHLLMGMVYDLLEGEGFKIYIHYKVPPNDGGIALGQAFHAIHLLEQ